jgi:hypothetical protein
MSDEQHKGEEPEVEAHAVEPAGDDEGDEVEAHVRRANVRLDSPKKF